MPQTDCPTGQAVRDSAFDVTQGSALSGLGVPHLGRLSGHLVRKPNKIPPSVLFQSSLR